jgi:hypothetical protein
MTKQTALSIWRSRNQATIDQRAKCEHEYAEHVAKIAQEKDDHEAELAQQKDDHEAELAAEKDDHEAELSTNRKELIQLGQENQSMWHEDYHAKRLLLGEARSQAAQQEDKAKKVVAAVQAEMQAMQKHKTAKRVKLNVGGTSFQTNAGTLAEESTFFDSMLSGRWEIELDEAGELFIDRDGGLFAYVLAFMRNRRLGHLGLTEHDLRALHVEAEYFQMENLMEAIDQDL